MKKLIAVSIVLYMTGLFCIGTAVAGENGRLRETGGKRELDSVPTTLTGSNIEVRSFMTSRPSSDE